MDRADVEHRGCRSLLLWLARLGAVMDNVQGLASKQGGVRDPGPCCPFKAQAGLAHLDDAGATCPTDRGEYERKGAWERLGCGSFSSQAHLSAGDSAYSWAGKQTCFS